MKDDFRRAQRRHARHCWDCDSGKWGKPYLNKASRLAMKHEEMEDPPVYQDHICDEHCFGGWEVIDDELWARYVVNYRA